MKYKLSIYIKKEQVVLPQEHSWYQPTYSYTEMYDVPLFNSLEEIEKFLLTNHEPSDLDYVIGWKYHGIDTNEEGFSDWDCNVPEDIYVTHSFTFEKNDYMDDGYWLSDDDDEDFWVCERQVNTSITYYVEEIQ